MRERGGFKRRKRDFLFKGSRLLSVNLYVRAGEGLIKISFIKQKKEFI